MTSHELSLPESTPQTVSSPPAVPRIECPDPAEFRRRFLARPHPVVITGAMDRWPAMQRWSLEYFAEHLGDAKVQALTMPEEREQDGGGEAGEERWRRIRAASMTMQEYIDKLGEPGGPRYYVAALPLRASLPKLLDDVAAPPYGDWSAEPVSPRLWFGSKVEGPLHYDQTHNLHGIVSGSKRFLFVSPNQLPYLYPSSMFSGMPHMSQASLRRPDHDRFPRLRKARPLEVTLHPGDLLFVPRGWWHEVSTPVPTISIDFPWPGGASLDWIFLRLVPSQLTAWYRRRRRQLRRPA